MIMKIVFALGVVLLFINAGFANAEDDQSRSIFSSSSSISFTARRGSDFTGGSSNSIVSYDQLDSTGSGMIAKTGTFTAPKSGVYAFNFQGLRYYPNGGDLRVRLRVNGNGYMSSYASPNGVSVSLFSVLNLKSGDQVAVSCDSGILYSTTEYFTVFSGFLLN